MIWWRHKMNEKFTSTMQTHRHVGLRWKHNNQIWDFTEFFPLFFANFSGNDIKLTQIYWNAFHFYLHGFSTWLKFVKLSLAVCWKSKIQSDWNSSSSSNIGMRNKIPVKYLEFYSFVWHVIEIFTYFFLPFLLSTRDKYFDIALENIGITAVIAKKKRGKNSNFIELCCPKLTCAKVSNQFLL